VDVQIGSTNCEAIKLAGFDLSAENRFVGVESRMMVINLGDLEKETTRNPPLIKGIRKLYTKILDCCGHDQRWSSSKKYHKFPL